MTIANTSEAQFEQEYGNSFLGTGNTLVNADTLLGMRAIDPDWRKQNMSVYERPIAGHNYITCLLYTSPSPRDKRQSRMPSSA